MSPTLTVEAIIFGIHSAIKLGKALQKAYANTLKSRRIALPLPDFSTDIKETTIEEFFNSEKVNGGLQYKGQIERLDFLHDKSELSNLTPEELEEYIDYYKAFFQMANGSIGEMSSDEVINLLRIRQWEQGKNPNPSPLQTVAGTLVEIGIDFFNQVPGAINTDSTKGQYLKSFLKAMDDIDFSESDGAELKKSIFKELVPKLFISVAELTADLSDELTKDEKFQDFLKITSQGLADDLTKRLHDIGTSGNQEEVFRWGKWIFSSMVKNAGTFVFNDPAGVFGMKEAKDDAGAKAMQEAKIKLIQSTGLAVMGAILDEDENLQLKAAFNVETLDSVIKAALETVAEYPELISKKDGIREIVSGTAKALADSGIQRPDLLPELVRLILENTAQNIDLLWDIEDSNSKHLLITASHQILSALAAKPTAGKWKPKMTKAQTLALVEDLLDEVVHNPQWLAKNKADDSILKEVIASVFKSLENVPIDQRLKVDTIHLIIQVSLRTVANNKKVLAKITWGTDDQEASILNGALDMVFACVYKQTTVVDKVLLLHELIDYVLEVLISNHPNRKGLVLTQFILHESAGVIQDGGFDEDFAQELAEAALSVISEHPDLLVDGEGLQQILSGVAGALADSGIDRPDLLPEFLRLVLEHSAGNIHLLIDTTEAQPKYLLVIALKEILAALATKTEAGKWQPQITEAQMFAICNSLFDEFLEHPEWLTEKAGEDSIFKQILDSVFSSLRKLSPKDRLKPETIEMLIQMSLRIAVTSQKVLTKVKWGTDLEEKTILNRILDLVFAHIFESGKYVNKEQMLYDLLDYIFEMILARHADDKGIAVVLILLSEELDFDFSDGIDIPSVNEIVEASLEILTEHPEFVSGKEGIQNIVVGVAGALKGSGINRPDLLPEFMRLVLEHSAGNMHLLVETTVGQPKYLLVIALREILAALATKTEAGKWQPQITEAQMFAICNSLFDDFLEHPEWLTGNEGEDSVFKQVLDAVFASLRNLPPKDRLKPETIEILIQMSLRMAVTSQKVLTKVKWGTDLEEKAMLNKVLDLVFAHIFESGKYVNKEQILYDLLDYIFETILARHADDKGLVVVLILLSEELDFDFSDGIDVPSVNEIVEACLEILEEHPELVSGKEGIQNIVVGVAGALKAGGIKQPQLLPEFIRLILEHTAGNLDILINSKKRKDKNILVIALKQTLKALSTRPSSGKWKPKLTENQILDIVRIVSAEVVNNVDWVKDDQLRILILAILKSLENITADKKPHPETLKILIEECLQAVNFRKQLIINTIQADGGTEKLSLTYTLDGLFITLYDKNNQNAGTWTLTQKHVIDAIIEHLLLGVSGEPSQAAIDASIQSIKQAVEDLKSDKKFLLADLLDELAK